MRVRVNHKMGKRMIFRTVRARRRRIKRERYKKEINIGINYDNLYNLFN